MPVFIHKKLIASEIALVRTSLCQQIWNYPEQPLELP